jgi:hypothetical protein
MPHRSLNGTWKLNVSASSLPFAQPQSVVLEIVTEGDDICFTENSVDAKGSTETVTIRARFDNKVYPVQGSGLVDGFAIERIHERMWRARGTKAENLMFTETITLSGDGTSFREEAETTLVDGTRAPATLIYERQK